MMKLPWRSLQVTVNVATIITGFCTCMPIAYVTYYFTGLCVLYADVQLEAVNTTAPSVAVDLTHSVWGAPRSCQYTMYVPILAAIHAFIWCWFFLLMTAELKAEQKEFPLLTVSLITHLVIMFIIFTAAGMVSAGVDIWCKNLVIEINSRNVFNHMVTCEETQNFNWTNIYQTKTSNVYNFLVTAKISSWLQTLTLLVQVLLCGYKLYTWVMLHGSSNLGECARISNSTGTVNIAYTDNYSEIANENTSDIQTDNNNMTAVDKRLEESRTLITVPDVHIAPINDTG